MIEHHPLDDFDLNDFFSCVATHGLAGAVALKQPELPAPAEDTEFATKHSQFQTNLMTDFFRGKDFQSMKAIARQFKDQFEATKQTVLAYSPEEEERKFYKETTIKTLAKVAKKNFDEAVTKSDQAVPNSPDQLEHRRQADDWCLIGQIVDIAVGLE